MTAPREIELKLAIARRDVPRLRQTLAPFGRPHTETLEAVYFDTRGFALARRHIALRLRRTRVGWVQTLKIGAPTSALSERAEYEMPVASARLDLAQFAGTSEARLHALKGSLGARFRTRFRRATWMTPDSAVEIALDLGEIAAHGRTVPICEVELELKRGEDAQLWRVASRLIGRGDAAIALLPFVDSKVARGVALARNAPRPPVKANAAALTSMLAADMPAGGALRTLVGAGTAALLANLHGLLDVQGGDPEFVHQARVAVRRMRSAIRLLRHEASFPARLAAELRWLGRALGEARDWDVLALDTLPALGIETAALKHVVAYRRMAALRGARVAVASPRCARLALGLLQWAATPAEDSNALAAIAPRLLREAWRRLQRASRDFSQLPPPEQHRVRILAKRLRYAVDVLACTFDVEALDALREELSQTQDALGELCDLYTAQRLLADLPDR